MKNHHPLPPPLCDDPHCGGVFRPVEQMRYNFHLPCSNSNPLPQSASRKRINLLTLGGHRSRINPSHWRPNLCTTCSSPLEILSDLGVRKADGLQHRSPAVCVSLSAQISLSSPNSPLFPPLLPLRGMSVSRRPSICVHTDLLPAVANRPS